MQDEILEMLRPLIDTGKARVETDSNFYFDLIWYSFPFAGDRIDWVKLRAWIRRVQLGEEDVVRFLEEVIRETRASFTDNVVILSDNAFDVAVIMTIKDLKEWIVKLVAFPQHLYVIPTSIDWCICFAFEGYMDFGFSPNLRSAGYDHIRRAEQRARHKKTV